MVSHPFILLFYLITGFINSLMGIFHKNTIEFNFFINNSVALNTENVFIEDQTKETGLRYGSKPFSHSGCGTAAVFNAFMSLGIPVSLPEIIRHFEGHGASLFGAFGTAPQSVKKFLKMHGIKSKSTADRRKFRELSESSDILILTIMNNRRKIRHMLHTMCIEHKDGFIVHNSHGRAESYRSYDDMMSSLGDGDNRAEGVYLIGIKKEPDQETQPLVL